MTLYLLPNVLSETKYPSLFLPPSVEKAVQSIDGLIAESETGGRRFLSQFKMDKKPHEVILSVYKDEDVDFLLEPLKKGETWGFVSDAGLPCIADPGSKLVKTARQRGYKIQGFVGPSSITMALMLSGMPGQSFAFHGYIDRDVKESMKKLTKGSTHIFIEAPHRNAKTLEALLSLLPEKSDLCVAWDLTSPNQGIVSQPVSVWKKVPLPKIEKTPAIYLVCV